MPSEASKELANTYREFNRLAKSLAPQEAFRVVSDHMVISLGVEPTEVTYAEKASCSGSKSSALLCKPVDADKGRCVLYLHGGGFMTGSPLSHRKLAGHLAKACGAWALVPDYRLAPEHSHPAQVEDAAASYRWLLSQGFSASRIALSGDSAGGCLAVLTVFRLVQMNLPLPGAVICFSPWCDMEVNGASLDSNSTRDFLISRENSALARDSWLQGSSKTDPFANPLYGDYQGFPPLFISVGTEEALLSDSETLAQKARAAGVEVDLEVVEGVQHVHVFQAGYAPEADTTIAKAAAFFKKYVK